MKIVVTTGKASPGYKHLKGQTSLADLGFIASRPFDRVKVSRQTKISEFFQRRKVNNALASH